VHDILLLELLDTTESKIIILRSLKSRPEASDLTKKIVKLAEELSIFLPKQDLVQVKFVNIEEKIRELINRVDKIFKTSFNEVTKDKNRSEVVVIFLALLHLLKDNLVRINQEDRFSDIEIVSTKKDAR